MTFAYFCIFFTIFLPLFCAAYAKKKAGFSMADDNSDPRGFLAKTEGVPARANAAQQNCYETFPPFAAAVIIAHATGDAGQGIINFWAGVFVLSRLAYIYCYVADKAALRSVAFSIGLLSVIALFIAAF